MHKVEPKWPFLVIPCLILLNVLLWAPNWEAIFMSQYQEKPLSVIKALSDVPVNDIMISEELISYNDSTGDAKTSEEIIDTDESQPEPAIAETITQELEPEYVSEVSEPEYISTDGVLTKSGGVNWYEGRKETWYSQRVLPGGGLDIPGRYVDDSGLIRDADGYICVACSDISYGSIVNTSLGAGKVYDSGCDVGITDIYTDW